MKVKKSGELPCCFGGSEITNCSKFKMILQSLTFRCKNSCFTNMQHVCMQLQLCLKSLKMHAAAFSHASRLSCLKPENLNFLEIEANAVLLFSDQVWSLMRCHANKQKSQQRSRVCDENAPLS